MKHSDFCKHLGVATRTLFGYRQELEEKYGIELTEKIGNTTYYKDEYQYLFELKAQKKPLPSSLELVEVETIEMAEVASAEIPTPSSVSSAIQVLPATKLSRLQQIEASLTPSRPSMNGSIEEAATTLEAANLYVLQMESENLEDEQALKDREDEIEVMQRIAEKLKLKAQKEAEKRSSIDAEAERLVRKEALLQRELNRLGLGKPQELKESEESQK